MCYFKIWFVIKYSKVLSYIFRFSVRPPTYYQKCREQQWYLSKLELERSILLQQFEELKQVILFLDFI